MTSPFTYMLNRDRFEASIYTEAKRNMIGLQSIIYRRGFEGKWRHYSISRSQFNMGWLLKFFVYLLPCKYYLACRIWLDSSHRRIEIGLFAGRTSSSTKFFSILTLKALPLAVPHRLSHKTWKSVEWFDLWTWRKTNKQEMSKKPIFDVCVASDP